MSAKQFVVRDPNYVARVKDAFSRQGFLRHIDARVEEIAPGRCVIAADFRNELAQQNGFFHGGLLGTIADAAGAGSAATLIEAQQWLADPAARTSHVFGRLQSPMLCSRSWDRSSGVEI